MKLSSTIENVPGSATLEMARKSRELRQKGVDVITFSLGEPDQRPPQAVLDAAKEAIDGDYHGYPPVNGYLELREAISEKFQRDNGLQYSPDNIVVSTGAKQCLFNVIISLIGPGDKVLLPAPYWVSYEGQVRLAGGEPVVIGTSFENDLKPDINEIADAIDERTRLLIFSSPNNPSGSVMTREELAELSKVIQKHPDLIVISDEIYEHIVFEGEHISIGTFPGMAERTVTVNGLSKAFAMTGWRLGYLGAPAWLAKACNKVQGQVTSGANTIAQRAAIAALKCDPTIFEGLRSIYLERRDLVLEKVRAIPGVRCNTPQGAFYVMPEIVSLLGKSWDQGEILNSNDLCMYLLEKAHVAVVDGTAFGLPGFFRLSYATSTDNINEGLDRITRAIAELR